MKQVKQIVLMLSLALSPLAIQAQDFNAIASAVKSGNAAEIAKFFKGNVEITANDGENTYSKSQAEIVLKNFFAAHEPKSFSIQHQGTSPEGSKYMVGNLVTSTGTYRMYIFTKAINGAPAIQEIKFEAQ